MIEIQESIQIEASTSEVFTYLMDIDNRKAYIPALVAVEFPDGQVLTVGSRYVEVASIAGRLIHTTYQVTKLEKDQEMAVKSLDGLFPIAVRLLLEEIAGGSRLTIELTAELQGFYRVAAAVIRPIIERQSLQILQNVKSNLESQ